MATDPSSSSITQPDNEGVARPILVLAVVASAAFLCFVVWLFWVAFG